MRSWGGVSIAALTFALAVAILVPAASAYSGIERGAILISAVVVSVVVVGLAFAVPFTIAILALAIWRGRDEEQVFRLCRRVAIAAIVGTVITTVLAIILMTVEGIYLARHSRVNYEARAWGMVFLAYLAPTATLIGVFAAGLRFTLFKARSTPVAVILGTLTVSAAVLAGSVAWNLAAWETPALTEEELALSCLAAITSCATLPFTARCLRFGHDA